MRWAALAIALATAILLLWPRPGYPHAPGTPFADWFNSRKEPDNPRTSCCGEADAFYVDEVRPDPDAPGGLIATVMGQEYRVPPEKVGWEDVNPTGRAVIYLTGSEEGYPATVLCFFPASGV